MIAITTLLLDSYRLLKARALFWITLGISGLVGLLYLSIGFNEDGMSLFFGLVSFEHELFRKGSEWAELLYIGIFTKFIVPLWITWIAIILGLISTASIFPDFMSEGSIELSLSKPVSRLKIFLTKYFGEPSVHAHSSGPFHRARVFRSQVADGNLESFGPMDGAAFLVGFQLPLRRGGGL